VSEVLQDLCGLWVSAWGQPPEFSTLPVLASTVPRHSSAPVSVTTNAVMSPTSQVPPPSSRAAGKQQLNYTSQPAKRDLTPDSLALALEERGHEI